MRLAAHQRPSAWRSATTVSTLAAVLTVSAASVAMTAPVASAEDAPNEDGIVRTDDLVERYSSENTAASGPVTRILVSHHPGARNSEEAREDSVTHALEEIGAEPEATELRQTATGAAVFETEEELSPERADDLIAQLREDDSVEYAEIDAVLTVAQTSPNDEYFSRQWALAKQQGGIDVLPAWEVTEGAGQTVAVIDTGVVSHPDLEANLVGGYDFISDASRARDGSGRDADPSDEGDWVTAGQCGSNQPANSSWHGTHVAGTVAAVTDNGTGIAGVAPDSKIVPIRVLGACGGYLSDISDAVVWAAGGQVSGVPANQHAADVINMSLGGAGQCSATYQRAIDLATIRGSLVVVAAGNENHDASQSQPANCGNTVTVGAVDANGARAPYSNYGSTVDVWAPGGNSAAGQGVLSTIDTGRTTPQGAGYGSYQGTSMAAPHVAGVAALVAAANPDLSVAELDRRVTSNGNGRDVLQAPAAVGKGTAPDEPSDPTDPDVPEQPEDPSDPPEEGADDVSQALLDATNRARADAGLPALEPRPELNTLAQDWAQTMAQRNRLGHRPDLRNHSTSEYGVSENVLMSRGRDISADEMVKMWMDSPGHRANLLDRNARWLGVGVATAQDGTVYAVQNFGVSRPRPWWWF